MELTEVQIQEYVDKNGLYCPFCGSMGLHTGKPEVGDSIIWQSVRCVDCGREWDDRYDLTSIHIGEEEDLEEN